MRVAVLVAGGHMGTPGWAGAVFAVAFVLAIVWVAFLAIKAQFRA